MKRYLILILVILVLASMLWVGCGDTELDKASWTEKQVIDYFYKHLMDKAEQLQGVYGESEKIIIDWGFRNAIFEVNQEVLREEELGEFVEFKFNETLPNQLEPLSIPTWTNALKKIAKYQGDGLWLVFVTGEWRVNERTGEVIAQDEEAAKLLEEITHETYHNDIYSYHIDYPAGWQLSEIDDEGQVLIVAPESQVDILIDKPRELEQGQSLGDCASGFAAFFSDVYQDFELVSLDKLGNGDYRMEYEWTVGGVRIHTTTYFVLHNSWFCMVTGSAPKSSYELYLSEFDYAYNSFGFD